MKRNQSIIINLIAGLLILLFAYTALDKTLRNDIFRISLAQSPLLAPVKNSVSILIPVIEFITVGLLFFEKTRKAGLFASLLLLLFFTSYILYILLFSSTIPCACGGVISRMTWKQHLFFNCTCILINSLAIWYYCRGMIMHNIAPQQQV